MAIFPKIGKYVINFLFLLFLAFLSVLILFLYKPSVFLHNIENYLSNSLESYFLDIDVAINSIEGNFFSGFNVENVKVSHNSLAALSIDNISIQPSLKDIFYGNLIFKSIEIHKLDIKRISNIVLNDEFISNNNFLMPNIIIKEIIIDNGNILYNNENILFGGKLNINVNRKTYCFEIESFNITLDDNTYYLNNGLINFSNEHVSIRDFTVLDDHELMGNFGLDLELFPLQIQKGNLSLKQLDIEVYDDTFITDVRFTANKQKKLNCALNLTLQIDNRKKYVDVEGYYDNNSIFFNLIDQKLLDDIFNLSGIYNLNSKNGSLAIESSPDNKFNLKGGMEYQITRNFNLDAEISIDMFSYKNFNFKEGLAYLTYKDKNIKVFEAYLKNLENVKFEVKDGLFQSLDKFSLSGTIQGEEVRLNLFNDLLDIDFKENISKDLLISYDYKRNLDSSYLNIIGTSEKILIDNAKLFNVKYDFISSGFDYDLSLSASKLTFNDYSFDSIDLQYSDNSIFFSSNNIESGEFLKFNSKFTNSNIFVNYLDAKINNVNIYTEKVSIFNMGNEYVCNDMDILINNGSLHANLNFKNMTNYSIDIFINDVNLNNIDKLMFLNNRYDGLLNGTINISRLRLEPLLKANLFIDNFRIDEFQYLKSSFDANINDKGIFINKFRGQNNLSSFDISGFIELDHNLKLSDNNEVNLKGEIYNFDISTLNSYLPWVIDIGGNITSEVLISGILSNIRFDMTPTIINPRFDKIYGNKIFGKVHYKNNRLYLSNIICQTNSGKYDVNGSLPANLNYFNNQDISLKPIYIDINANSQSMEFLTPYFPFIKDFKGVFEYTLNIHGNYKNTIRDGTIVIRNAYLDLLQLDNRINNINSYAVINNNRLIINNFKAELSKSIESKDLIAGITSSMRDVLKYDDWKEDREISVSGSMNLDSFFNPDLSINLIGKNNYFSSSYGQFEGIGNSNIAITGKDTILISGEFYPQFNNFTLFDIESRRGNTLVEEITDSKFIAYDIYMPFPNGIKIKSDNIDLLLEGEMNLSSFSNNDITVSGKANIIEGNFFYNGNEFYGTQGTILIDPISESPYVEIHSMTDIYEDNISVSFIGYTDNPNLILESTSSNYSQSDILQLLTFRDKNLDQSISEPFSNLITNYLETQLEKNITLYTDLDEFRLQHSGSLIKGFGDAGISIFMGKRISNRLYLNTKINLNNNNLNEYEMSYRLNSNTSIVAKIDDNKYWKLNYRFKYKY